MNINININIHDVYALYPATMSDVPLQFLFLTSAVNTHWATQMFLSFS